MEDNLEKDFVSNKDDLAEILNIEKDNIIKIENTVEEVNQVKIEDTKEIREFRHKYNEEEIKNKICIICGKTNCGGIIILDKKICLECEEKAINADVKSEFYSDYKDKITKNVVGKFKNQNLG